MTGNFATEPNQFALTRHPSPIRQLVRDDVMAPCDIDNARTGLETLSNNPRLHIIRPTPVTPTRFNNIKPTHKSTSIRHSILQQKQWRMYQPDKDFAEGFKSMGRRRRIRLGEGCLMRVAAKLCGLARHRLATQSDQCGANRPLPEYRGMRSSNDLR
jgi:hypothetical protein